MEKNKTKVETKKSTEKSGEILAVIRIAGMVKVKPNVKEALDRLKLRRKYACILLNSSNNSMKGMLDLSKYHVAYGPVEKETLGKLLKARAFPDLRNCKTKEERDNMEKVIMKKLESPEKVVEEIFSGKDLKELGIKPFFRLHPPRKGIDSKIQYPKGVLGNNKKDINKLIERML